jgi:hypothetical protein
MDGSPQRPGTGIERLLSADTGCEWSARSHDARDEGRPQ